MDKRIKKLDLPIHDSLNYKGTPACNPYFPELTLQIHKAASERYGHMNAAQMMEQMSKDLGIE